MYIVICSIKFKCFDRWLKDKTENSIFSWIGFCEQDSTHKSAFGTYSQGLVSTLQLWDSTQYISITRGKTPLHQHSGPRDAACMSIQFTYFD